MATKRVTTADKKTTAPKRVRSSRSTGDNVVQFTPEHEAIARRAYELFQSRGMSHGRDVDDWLAAERELIQR